MRLSSISTTGEKILTHSSTEKSCKTEMCAIRKGVQNILTFHPESTDRHVPCVPVGWHIFWIQTKNNLRYRPLQTSALSWVIITGIISPCYISMPKTYFLKYGVAGHSDTLKHIKLPILPIFPITSLSLVGILS